MAAEANGGWAIEDDYGPLRDVLLGRPDYFEWHPISSIAKRTLQNAERMGFKFDRQTAVSQHREMVDIYEGNGVACHFIDAEEHLHLNVFARDSNCMTPFGPIITHMQIKWRRPDYVTAIKAYQDAGIPIFKMVTAGHFEGGDFVVVEVGYKECVKLGCNIVALGNDKVLSMQTNADLNGRLRALGFEVFDPDMSQFQMGGGGVHCLSQALRRFDA